MRQVKFDQGSISEANFILYSEVKKEGTILRSVVWFSQKIRYKDQTDACYRSDEGSMDFYTLLRDKGGGRRGTLENTRERRLKSWVDLNHDDDWEEN